MRKSLHYLIIYSTALLGMPSSGEVPSEIYKLAPTTRGFGTHTSLEEGLLEENYVVANPPGTSILLRRLIDEFNRATLSLPKEGYYKISQSFYEECDEIPRTYKEDPLSGKWFDDGPLLEYFLADVEYVKNAKGTRYSFIYNEDSGLFAESTRREIVNDNGTWYIYTLLNEAKGVRKDFFQEPVRGKEALDSQNSPQGQIDVADANKPSDGGKGAWAKKNISVSTDMQFTPRTWSISDLPGVQVAKTVQSKTMWPPSDYLDEAHTVPLNVEFAAIAAVPIVATAGETVSWFALVIPRKESYPEKLGTGLLKAGSASLVRVMRDGSFSTFEKISFDKHERNPAAISSTRLSKLISLRATGDKLFTFSYPVVTVDGDYTGVEMLRVRLRHLASKKPERVETALDDSAELCSKMELRDVNGDGKGEIFCVGSATLSYSQGPGMSEALRSRGCPTALAQPGRVYTQMEPVNRGPWTQASLWQQPALYALANFAASVGNGKTAVSFASLKDAAVLSRTTNLAEYDPTSMELSGDTKDKTVERFLKNGLVFDEKIYSLLNQNISDLDTWHCIGSIKDTPSEEDLPYVHHRGFRILPWEAVSQKVDPNSGAVRWDGEDALSLVDKTKTMRCDQSGCTDAKSAGGAPPSRLSPDGTLRFAGSSSVPTGTLLVVLEKQSEYFDDKEMWDKIASDPCMALDWDPKFNNKEDDKQNGFLFPFYPKLESDGEINLCGTTCCRTDNALVGGTGFVAWLNGDQLLFAGGMNFTVLTMSTRSKKRISPQEIPDTLLDVVGITQDRNYRFFIDRENQKTTLWRADLKNGTYELLFNPAAPENTPNRWGVPLESPIGKPASWVIPSPSGRRIAVVIGGEIVSVSEISDEKN